MSYTLARRALCAAALSCCAIAASAQTFYEPVQAQYQYNSQTFYYGGSDPRVFDHIISDIDKTTYAARATSTPAVVRLRIYSDASPTENLADNSRSSYRSFTAADAQNEANANAPRYFRKRDLLRAAAVMPDGSRVVPAAAQPRAEAFTLPTGQKLEQGTILIIPRKLIAPKESPAIALVK